MTILNLELLQKTFLSELTSDQVKSLEECCYLATFKANEFIFERGREASRFFLIQSGKVNLELYTREQGAKVTQTLGPAEFLGTSWMVSPFKWKMDARAAIDSELIVFNASKVKEKCDKDQGLGYALMRCFFVALSERLDAAQNQIRSIYTNHAAPYR